MKQITQLDRNENATTGTGNPIWEMKEVRSMKTGDKFNAGWETQTPRPIESRPLACRSDVGQMATSAEGGMKTCEATKAEGTNPGTANQERPKRRKQPRSGSGKWDAKRRA